MKKLLLLIVCLVCLVQHGFSQDKHFTQFYAAPMTLNPALTGVMEGKYRVGMNYRDQWRRVLDNPIKTFAVGADLRFDSPARTARQDAIGLGINFVNDKVPVIDFNTTQVAIALAYHKALDVNKRQFLSLGLQAGLTQRSVNYASLNFHDQFDGSTGYTFGTGENLPGNNISYTDYNVGLNYTAKIGKYGGVYAGLALHHFLQPNISFYETKNEGDKLYRKLSGQFSANIPLQRNNRVSFLPRFLFAAQGPHLEINTGANLRFVMGKYGTSALVFGSWVRPVKNNDGMGIDAVVALLGFEISNVVFGFSYDLNLEALSANQRQGAFELSVTYLGNYENEEILCPKF